MKKTHNNRKYFHQNAILMNLFTHRRRNVKPRQSDKMDSQFDKDLYLLQKTYQRISMNSLFYFLLLRDDIYDYEEIYKILKRIYILNYIICIYNGDNTKK